jgi:hypothetical protein
MLDQPSGQCQKALSPGLQAGDRKATQAAHLAGELVCDHVQRQPGRVGAEFTAGHVVECQPVLEVADHILDHGVLAMVGLQLQRVALPIGVMNA